MEMYEEEMRRIKKVYKEGKMKGGEVKNWSEIKGKIGRLVVGECNVCKSLREQFEDLYNVDTEEEWVTINICSFDGIIRGN